MAPSETPPTLALIRAARAGDRGAVDALFSMAYHELRDLARRVRRRTDGQTLNTTVLVHEAYLKLRPENGLDLRDRAHFAHIVARAMRQVLVDAARRRSAAKRGGGEMAVTLDESAVPAPLRAEQVLHLEEALQELARVDPRKAGVVECRFFGGLTVEETAEALGISEPTVKRDWRVARAWLAQAVADPERVPPDVPGLSGPS